MNQEQQESKLSVYFAGINKEGLYVFKIPELDVEIDLTPKEFRRVTSSEAKATITQGDISYDMIPQSEILKAIRKPNQI